MAMDTDLGKLICMLNPYTQDRTKTTEMDIYVENPDPTKIPTDYKQVDLEVDTEYPGDWTFKEQPQRINTAARIKYRYGVLDPNDSTHKTVLYWIDDYLLIGYEGSGGP